MRRTMQASGSLRSRVAPSQEVIDAADPATETFHSFDRQAPPVYACTSKEADADGVT